MFATAFYFIFKAFLSDKDYGTTLPKHLSILVSYRYPVFRWLNPTCMDKTKGAVDHAPRTVAKVLQ